MNLNYWLVRIVGQTPLLMKRKLRELILKERLPENHPLRDLISGETITAKDQKRDDVLRCIGDLGAYRNGHGCFMPAMAVKHSYIEGARKGKVKDGRSALWPKLQGTMFPTPGEILVTRNGEELETYDHLKDSLVRGSSGVVLQYQAQISLPWEMEHHLLVLDASIDGKLVEDSIRSAGLYAGIGSWISGGYGRYTLDSFEPAELPNMEEATKLLQPV